MKFLKRIINKKETNKNLIVENKLGLTLFVLPVTLFSAYTFFIAEPRYVSNSSIVIQNISGVGEIGGMQALLMAGIQGGGATDLMIVKEYINSSDMLNDLDEKYKILEHWSSPKFDYLYRLNDAKYKELSLDYFKSKIKPLFNPESGTLEISVETYDPYLSKKVMDYVIKRSEDFVNENNHKGSKEQLKFIEEKILEIKKNLDSSRVKMLNYQKDRKLFTPEAETSQASRKIIILEESKIKAEAEYNAKKSFVQENAPQMITLMESIKYLDGKIEEEKKKLIGGKDNKKSISDYSDEYKLLEGELNLNIEAYKNALITYEKVKFDASRKLKQIVMVSSPQVPDYPQYPNKKMDILLSILGFGMFFGIISLLKNIVKEHR